jgi:O-antigen/teichoic acid export membrane protein
MGLPRLGVRVAKNVFLLTVTGTADKVAAVLWTIVLARGLGVDGYGTYSIAVAFTSLFTIVADLGLRTLLIREVASDKDHVADYLGISLQLKTVFSAVAAIIMVSAGLCAGYPNDILFLILLASLVQVATSFLDFVVCFFRAFERMLLAGLLPLLARVFCIGVGLYVLTRGGLADSILIEMLVVYFFASVIALLLIRKVIVPGADVGYAFAAKITRKSVFLRAVPFAVDEVAGTVNLLLPINILGLLASTRDVGLYNTAFVLITNLCFVAGTFSGGIFPTLSDLYRSQRVRFDVLHEKMLKYLIWLGLPASVALAMISGQVIELMYGPAFIDAAPVVGILCVMLFFKFVNYGLNTTLTAAAMQWVRAVAQVAVLFVNLVCCVLLIPRYGLLGSSIAYVKKEVLRSLGYYLIV